jgi:hypothetical protein
MRALWELARHQLGLITWAQAIQLVTEDEFRTLVDQGHIERRRRGVYAVAGTPPSYEQAVLAAVLAVGGPAWASHRTAARLHGLKVPVPEAIDVLTLPNKRMRIVGVAQHRNQVLPLRDLGRAGAVPATTVAKTLVDCTPWLPGLRLTRAIDDARRRKLVTYEEVELAHAELDKGRRTGRHLVVPLRPVVADRHDAGGSDRELDVRGILRRTGLPLPVQQHPVFVAGRWRFLDDAYPEPMIYLEFDGFAEHGVIRETFDDDRERDAELALLGWIGIRYTSNTRAADLVSRVRRALEVRAA